MKLKTRKQKKQMSGIKNVWFFKNINKIHNLLARLTKKERKDTNVYQYQA